MNVPNQWQYTQTMEYHTATVAKDDYSNISHTTCSSYNVALILLPLRLGVYCPPLKSGGLLQLSTNNVQ